MYEVVHNPENMEVTQGLKEYPTQNIAGGCVRIRIYGSTLFAKAPTLPYPLNQKTTFIENSQKVSECIRFAVLADGIYVGNVFYR